MISPKLTHGFEYGLAFDFHPDVFLSVIALDEEHRRRRRRLFLLPLLVLFLLGFAFFPFGNAISGALGDKTGTF